MADVQDALDTTKNKRRISSIPSTPGRSNNSPERKQPKGQGQDVQKGANESLQTEIERVIGAILDKNLDLLASPLESKIKTKIAELEAKFQNVQKERKELKEDVSDSINDVEYVLKQDIDCTWEYAVKNGQYSRKNNLRILGLDEGEDENFEEKPIEAIAKNLNETVESKEIEIIHQIGQRLSNQVSSGNRKPRPEEGTKVGPDQLGSPVRVGSTRINSDHEKNIKLNEIETFTHLKVKIPVKNGPF